MQGRLFGNLVLDGIELEMPARYQIEDEARQWVLQPGAPGRDVAAVFICESACSCSLEASEPVSALRPCLGASPSSSEAGGTKQCGRARIRAFHHLGKRAPQFLFMFREEGLCEFSTGLRNWPEWVTAGTG